MLKYNSPINKFTLALQIGNVVAYIFMILMNIIAYTAKFNGNTSETISNKYPTRFTPAGFAFGLWVLIYILLGVFTAFQALPINHEEQGFVRRINVFFILNAICNGWWTYAFAYEEFWVTVLLILTMLFSLIAIYILLPINPRLTPKQLKAVDLGLNTRYYMILGFVHMPFSFYIAWIIIVMVANFFVFSAAPPFGNTDSQSWSIVLQSIIAAITLLVLFFQLDVIFGGVITWSFIAIAIQQRDYGYVCFTAGLLSGAVGVSTILTILYRLVYNWYLPLHGGRFQLLKSNSSQKPFAPMAPIREDPSETSTLTSKPV